MLEVITVFIILILCLYHYWKSRPCASNFPGPAGIPLFGVFFNVDLNRLHLKLYEWTLIYGNIFQFSVFGKSYISLNSADVIRDVLGLEPNATITASREPSFFGEYCLENYSDIVFSPYDEEWARRRKIGHQLLHTYGVGMHFLEDEILQKLADMKQFIRENEGKDLDPHDMVEEFLFKNLSSLVAGTTDPQLQRLMKEVDENANEIASPMVDLIFRMFPFLRFLPLSVARKPSLVKFCMDEMLKIIKELTNEGNIERGIYYELKNAKERHGLHFTDNHIKAILVNIIGAGISQKIITNLWTNNHSDEWHDPFVFRPERFMDDSGLLLPATHPTRKRLLVFGFGKRACLGEVFAKNRTFLFLATMMQTCIIRKPLREELSDLDPRMMMPGVVLQPPPYKVQFKLRERVL
ncbi:cytochrome P450 2J6-like isoform X2 [Ostrea edulis]|uniref:cytochrome P450 2J6-like isoform X2 n=1 Tax=Ostrea edulis TaxID=37623 RepID=UPI00209475E1|nr:cytochrome P450 2J6-like isoform X2 [Ostrea edulis]